MNETGAEGQMDLPPPPWVLTADVNRRDSLFCVTESVSVLCFHVNVSVQIMQPYCLCYQFLSPFFQNPSYLPACYLFACLLIYHLLCHFDLHVVLRGRGGPANVFTGALTRLPETLRSLIISDWPGLKVPWRDFLSTKGALDVFFTNWT